MTNILKEQLINAKFCETENNYFSIVKLKNYYNITEVIFNKFRKYEVNIIDAEFNINEKYIFKTENEVIDILKNKKII